MLRPRPAWLVVEALRQPAPVVCDDQDASRSAIDAPLSSTRTDVGLRVLDGVVEQLGHRHRERGGQVRRERTPGALPRDARRRAGARVGRREVAHQRRRCGRRSRRSRPAPPPRRTATRARRRSAATRSSASASASFASAVDARRAWRRSSAATVCRLFFTRWWISRIVASLLMQRPLAAAQVRHVLEEHDAPRSARPSRTSGMPRSRTTAVAFSTSARPGRPTATPPPTAPRPSGPWRCERRTASSANEEPTTSVARPETAQAR